MIGKNLAAVLGLGSLKEGDTVVLRGRSYDVRDGLLRDRGIVEKQQAQTRDAFAFKWGKRETYDSPEVQEATRQWECERYGDLSAPAYWQRFPSNPLVLDAGCGAGLTAKLLIGPMLRRVRYIGVDISAAADLARATFLANGLPGDFLQADLLTLPFEDGMFDFILSEGVLHHTRSTREAIDALARLLRPGGSIAFYVYARKSPVREYTDDYLRLQLQPMQPDQAWEALMPLTKLGRALGELKLTIDVPEAVPLLGIPKGPVDLQRLIYWHFCKMYYRPEYSVEEMNHVNFDWFMPAYAHRQTPTEVRQWCEEAGLEVQSMKVEEAGITTHAVRPRR